MAMMKQQRLVPDQIAKRTSYKHTFSLWEMYRLFVMIPSAAGKMIRNRRKHLVSASLVKRMQLAVTEVFGCTACSYAHASAALKQGLSSQEVYSFLNGDGEYVRREEAKAVLFAQHVAETRGIPEAESYQAVVDAYGKQEAQIMLSAAQLMILGNMFGIHFSALQKRFKGASFSNSSLLYELAMLTGGVLLLLLGLVNGVLRCILGYTNIVLN